MQKEAAIRQQDVARFHYPLVHSTPISPFTRPNVERLSAPRLWQHDPPVHTRRKARVCVFTPPTVRYLHTTPRLLARPSTATRRR
eukprot:1117217-Prymnesium_polylepis.1